MEGGREGEREGGDSLPQHPLGIDGLSIYSPIRRGRKEGRKEGRKKGRQAGRGISSPPTLILSPTTASNCSSRSLRYTKGGSLDSRYGQSATSVAATAAAFPVYLTTAATVAAAAAGPGAAAAGTAMQVVPILAAQALRPPNDADEGERIFLASTHSCARARPPVGPVARWPSATPTTATEDGRRRRGEKICLTVTSSSVRTHSRRLP